MTKRKGQKWKQTWDEWKAKWLEGGIQACFSLTQDCIFWPPSLWSWEQARQRGERLYGAPRKVSKADSYTLKKAKCWKYSPFRTNRQAVGGKEKTEPINSQIVRHRTKRRNRSMSVFTTKTVTKRECNGRGEAKHQWFLFFGACQPKATIAHWVRLSDPSSLGRC